VAFSDHGVARKVSWQNALGNSVAFFLDGGRNTDVCVASLVILVIAWLFRLFFFVASEGAISVLVLCFSRIMACEISSI